MRRCLRPASAFLLLALSVSATGCGSNNQGKIEGKWKFISFPKQNNEVKELADQKCYLYLEFKSGGVLDMGVESDDATIQKLLVSTGNTKLASSKYKLLNGDYVEFYELPKELQEQQKGGLFGKKDRGRIRVNINGSDMVLTDDDGISNLTRMK